MSKRLLSKVISDSNLRTKLILFGSLMFDAAYSAFLILIGKINSSGWFIVMSAYYGLLFVARIFIFSMINNDKNPPKAIKVMRVCGIFLLLINIAVAFMMLFLIRENEGRVYNEIVVIAIAAYTFSTFTLAIIESAGQYKRRNYIYFCAKLINLICASVSMATLADVMLSTFGEGELQLRSIMLPLLCTAVSVFTVSSAILMIRKANYDMRVIEDE